MYAEMKAYKNIKFDQYERVKRDGDSERQPAEVFKDAQVVSSELIDGPFRNKDMHYIALDIDLPVVVVPSSTEHHTHLYIPKEVTWKQYLKFIEACVEIGIVERGYLEASKRRKATFLRLPWIKKGMENLTSIDSIEEFLSEEDGPEEATA